VSVGKQIALAMGVVAAIVVISVGGWQLHWWMARHGVNNRYQVNTSSQEYQSSLVTQERDRALAFDKSQDTEQRAVIRAQFCQVLADIHPIPADIELDAAHLNC
jgi:hypothetical protein